MKKRIISLCIAVALLFAMLPQITLSVDAAEVAESGTCGENLTWTFDDGTLIISGTGPMYDYNWGDGKFAPWYLTSYNAAADMYAYLGSPVTHVIIDDGVTSIGAESFSGCTAIVSVEIPNSVTVIKEEAFRACKNITEINLPDSLQTIEDRAFHSCNNLSVINWSSSLKTIGTYAFSYCKNLTSIAIPDGVKTIEKSAFWQCENLTSITIPNTVSEIGEDAFKDCKRLTSITVSPENSYFSSDSYGVLYTKDYSTLLKVPEGFSGSYSVPDGVKHIGKTAFADCDGLTAVHIPKSVESVDAEAFSRSKNLNGIWVDSVNTYLCSDSYGVLFTKDMATLLRIPGGFMGKYTIPESVTRISEYAAFYCLNLTEVIIPYGVHTIEGWAFRTCSALTHIDIPESVKTIGDQAFSACHSLTEVSIPDGVESIGNLAFEFCKNLSTVTIAGSVSSIGWAAFSSNDLDSVTFMGDAPEIVGYETEEDKYVFSRFSDTVTTIYYPAGNGSWSEEVRLTFGRTHNWVAIDLPNPDGFWIDRDGWTFANSSFSFREDSESPFSTYYIPEERYDEVFGTAYLKANRFSKKWGGNCAGMSTTAILFSLDYLDWQTIDDRYPNDFSTPNSFYQTINYHYASQSGYAAIGNATEVTRLIEAYQLYINEVDRSEYEALLDGTYHDEEFTKDGIFSYYTQEHLSNGTYISSMLEVFSKAYDENTPLYISLKGDDFSHAIVSRTDKKPEDIGNGWWRVYVYDPNKPYVNDSIAEKFWETYPDAGLKDACNDIEEDVYIELNPSQNLWRYCTSVNSDSSSKYLGCNLNNEVLYIKCDATDGEGNKLTVKIPEYFYTIDLNDIPISDYVHPTTTAWMPENTDDGCIISVDGISDCLVYSSSGTLSAVIENGEAIVLNGDGYYVGYTGEAEESTPAGGKLYLPSDTYTVRYTSGQMAFLGSSNVISISGETAMDLIVDVAENSVQIMADNDGTVSIKCANVISADKCSYVETEGTLVAGETFTIAYSDENKVTASTDSKDGEFQLYQKNADQEEVVATKVIKSSSLWWLWIVGGVAVAGVVLFIIMKKKKPNS